MAYEQRNNTGSLWVNDKKTEDKHPDRTGTIVVEGVEYFLDGWLKETKGGKKFLSLSVKRKTKQGAQAQQLVQRPAGRPQPPQPAQRQRPAGLPTRPPARPPADPDLDPVDPATGEYKF